MAECHDCDSKQTYCMINQAASHWVENAFSNIELITPEPWNNIKNILQNIYDFGEKGTRNPPQDSINNISDSNQNNLILLTLYNSIINALKTGDGDLNSQNGQTINPYTLISQSLLNNIKTYIDNYQLNPDRCAGCNASCNGSDGCGYMDDGCYYGGGGGCSADCSAGCQGSYGGGGGYCSINLTGS